MDLLHLNRIRVGTLLTVDKRRAVDRGLPIDRQVPKGDDQ
jgi:hypothetical protein